MPDGEPEQLFEAPPIAEEMGQPLAATEAPRKRARRSAAAANFFEYMAPDGKPWRCDAPDKVFVDFGIRGDSDFRRESLTRLHADLGVVPASWDVIRRLYRMAPVVGATKDEMRAWTMEEIAKESNVPAKRIEAVVEEAKIYWSRKCNERNLVTKAVEGPTVEALGDLDDEQIAKLLSKHGFEEVPPTYQRYMARRIVEFQHLLDDEQGGHLARSALMQELILSEYDRQIQRALVNSNQKDLDGLVSKRSSLQATYENSLERLGATQEQNPGYRAKIAFGDSLGHLAKAMHAYYAEGDNSLIDGLHTAAEIKLLMTPALNGLRPAQYRPDLALLVEQWRANFWDPNWDGAKLPREMHRCLLGTFRRASEEFAAGKTEEMEIEEVEAGEVEMAVAESVGEEGGGEVAEASTDEMAMPAPREAAHGSRAPRGEEFAGWAS